MKRTMVHGVFATGLAVAVGLGFGARTAQAQDARGLQVGVGGGLVLPTGELADELDPGFRIEGVLTVNRSSLPVGFRGSVAYDRLSDSAGHGDMSILAGVVDVIYRLPGMVATPYLLAGGGAFRIEEPEEHEEPEDGVKFGFNVGAGLDFRVRGVNAFVEARWQNIATEHEATRLIPLTIGIRR